MIILLIAIVILALGIIVYIFMQDGKENIKSPEAPVTLQPKEVTKTSTKEPILAAVLSFFIPGSGQLYNGQISKAFLFLLTAWLIIPWFWGIFDAYIVAKNMREGKGPYKEAAVGCLVALIVVFLVFIPGCALLSAIAIPNLLRAKISANQALAKATLRSISTASESYSVANDRKYPNSINDLTQANPPYLNNAYCGQTISGYVYQCKFDVSGYQFTAIPVVQGSSGEFSYKITTGGDLTEQ